MPNAGGEFFVAVNVSFPEAVLPDRHFCLVQVGVCPDSFAPNPRTVTWCNTEAPKVKEALRALFRGESGHAPTYRTGLL